LADEPKDIESEFDEFLNIADTFYSSNSKPEKKKKQRVKSSTLWMSL